MPEEPSSAEVLQRLALSLKSIRDELQLWHAESQQNQAAIDSLGKRLDMLSQKTEVPPKVRQELDEIKSLVQAVSSKPGPDVSSIESRLSKLSQDSASERALLEKQIEDMKSQIKPPDTSELKATLEAKLSELKSEIGQIKSLQSRVGELAKKYDSGDERHDKEIESLKGELSNLSRELSTSATGQEFLSGLQAELKDWHKESVENTKEITLLLNRLSAVEEKTAATDKVKGDVGRIMKEIDAVADSIEKFGELKQNILKHNEEFQDLYSTIGKERVELDSLNTAISKLQDRLGEWSERNSENQEEVRDIKQAIADLARELKSKDVTTRVHELSDSLSNVADRVAALQRQESEIQETQQRMVEFDRGLKELVRKAVIASLSRKEFEEELDQLESGATGRRSAGTSVMPMGRRPAPVAEEEEGEDMTLARGQRPGPSKPVKKPVPAPTRPAPPAEEPSVPDIKAKLRQLREALKEEPANESIMERFAEFEEEVNSASSDDEKKLLWNNMLRDISHSVRGSIDAARKKLEEAKAAGEDTSKINLLVAKADINVVSLETTVSLRNLVKTKEIAQKLSELKSQIDAVLGEAPADEENTLAGLE